MTPGGEAQGVAADLELRQRLDEASSHMTPAAHAIDGLRIIADHARRWLAGTPAQADPTDAMRTIGCVAEAHANRATAMQDDELTRTWR